MWAPQSAVCLCVGVFCILFANMCMRDCLCIQNVLLRIVSNQHRLTHRHRYSLNSFNQGPLVQIGNCLQTLQQE